VKIIRFGLVALAATCLLSVQASAQSAAGTWKGKLHLDAAAMKAKDPKAQQMMQSVMAMVKNMTFALQVNKNNTWKMDIVGAPQQAGKTPSETGTWSQAGSKVTMKTNKKAAKSDTQTLTMSKDGKTMTLTAPKGAGPGGAIVFKRA
jgi:hypothetical protein